MVKLLIFGFVFVVMSNRIPTVQGSCFNQIIDPKLEYIGGGVEDFVYGQKIVHLQFEHSLRKVESCENKTFIV